MGDTSRRAFLAGVSSVGLAGFGIDAVSAATGQTTSTDTTFDDTAGLERTVDDLMSDRIGTETAGATVAIVEGGELVLAKGYGTADANSGDPVRASETAFRIGSVSKLLTYTAVMQGVERGTLDLDTDVNAYLADSSVEIPDSYDDPITLRHLGTHTGGFAGVPNPGMVERADDVESLETVLRDARPERVRPPGEAVAYSNYGAALAGHVVAAAHDATFESYAQSEIFEPLGMSHSTFSQPVPGDYPVEVARPHTPAENGFAVPDPVYINWRPAGSVTATATDMAAFMNAHLEAETGAETHLFEPETAREMYRRQFERHPAVNNVRYGFWEYGRPDESLIGHSGATLYFLSQLLLVPDSDVGIFVGYNTRGAGNPGTVVEELARSYDLGFEPFTPESTARSDAGQRAEQVAGEYRSTIQYESGLGGVLSRMQHLHIEPTDDGRLLVDNGQEQQAFVETEPHVYHEIDGHDLVAFDIVDGDVERAHLNSTQQASFEPVSFGERQLVAGGTAGAAMGGFALSTLGWSGLAAWRRWRDRSEADEASPEIPTEPTGDEAAEEMEGSA